MKTKELHFHIKTDPDALQETEKLVDTIHEILKCTEWHDIKKIQLYENGLIVITVNAYRKWDD